MKRIGMLTSGGDCQSLNATMRGVVKGLNVLEGTVEIYGFIDGYKGLIYGNYKRLTSKDFSGILTTGGTILGTSRQPFKLMRTPDENGLDKVEAMKSTYRYLDLDCLVVLGGNGSQKTANLLREEGLNIVSLPKTIDNDLWGTDMTFGFQSAVDIATQTIDCIHTTAASHNRVFIVELMGHKVGWVTLHAGIAGGADIILIPEIPYDLKHVISAIQRRNEQGKHFTILAVAEGAISKEDATAPARILAKFAKTAPALEIKAGVVEGDYYDAAGMQTIASVPSRQDLLSKLLGSIQSPITNFARVINQIAEQGGAANCEPAATEETAEEAPAAEETPAE